jgi:hypothetical protein
MVIPLKAEVHRQALVRLWKENFKLPRLDGYADRRFDWLYQENPFGSARTWIALETESDAVIGGGTIFPSHKYIRGRLVRTGVAVDFAVDRKHRLGGAALAIQRAVISGSFEIGFDFLLGKPNEKALPIFSRAGYRPIGDAQDWVKIIGTEDEPAGFPDPSDYRDEIVGVADERFNRLWEVARFGYPIIGDKSAAFLNWRYGSFQEQGYRFYCLLSRENHRLLGYLAFYPLNRAFFIEDVFCESPGGAILDNLLLGFASRMKMQGAEWIGLSYLGAPWFEESLKRLGFRHGQHQYKLALYVGPHLPVESANEILQKDNWFIFGGEMDVF